MHYYTWTISVVAARVMITDFWHEWVCTHFS